MDNSDLYSARIEKTFDEDQNEILSFLKDALANKPKLIVRLINYYKGLPVSYPATIVEIEKDTIELDVYPHQAVIMSDCRYTFIRYKGLKHDLYANVSYMHIRRLAVSLKNLFYVEIMAERREYIRLDLDHPIEAFFTTNEGIERGYLKELSYNGAGIIIDHSCSLEVGENIVLKFMLQNATQNHDYNINIPAMLLGINGDSFPKYYRFATSPDKKLDQQIAHFIFQRQIEIIQEIKVVADRIEDTLSRNRHKKKDTC